MSKYVTLCLNEKNGELGDEIPVMNLTNLEAFTRASTWSPYLFNRDTQYQENGKPYKITRNKKNFKRAHFFAIDIDKGTSLNEAVELIKKHNLRAFINTSQSHQQEGKGDRFRVVFELARPIENPQEIAGTFEYIKAKYFPTLDKACKDTARFFKRSKDLVLINDGEDTETIKPALLTTTIMASSTDMDDNRLRLSMTTDIFINTAQKEGERHLELVKACKNAGQQGWTKEQFQELLRLDINPWLAEEKHKRTIDDIFDNQRWEGSSPYLPTENTRVIAGAVQSKWTGIWLKNNKVTSTYDGTLLINKEAVSRSKVTRDLRLEAARLNLNMSPSLFEDIIDEYIDKRRHDYLDSIKRQLNQPVNEDEGKQQLDQFLELLCGPNLKETDAVMMRHFIWNVKRRMNGQLGYREVMPIIKGRDHGTGKSYNIKNNFLGPLRDLKKETDFKQLEDGRELKLLSDNFVLVFDEMSYASMSNVDNIKRLITETNITIRRMRETTHEYLPKNAQFIGTTNREITSLISDYTGMRRFYSIESRSRESIEESLPQYHEKFNKIDYLKIWQSVDATKESPILECLDKIEAIQNEYISSHLIDDWIDNSGYVELVKEEDGLTKATDLLDSYNSYQGSLKINPKKFNAYLTESKYHDKLVKVRKKDGIYYNLILNQKTLGEY